VPNGHCYLTMSASLSATRQSFSSFTSRYSTRPSRRKSSKLLNKFSKQQQINAHFTHYRRSFPPFTGHLLMISLQTVFPAIHGAPADDIITDGLSRHSRGTCWWYHYRWSFPPITGHIITDGLSHGAPATEITLHTHTQTSQQSCDKFIKHCLIMTTIMIAQ